MLTERRERGQVLILFIALFSVLLTMAAIGIDQGLWLGERGIAQKDADAAARAGAAVYLSAIATPSPVAATAGARAVEYAVANGAPIATVTPDASGCPTTGSSPNTIPDAPSVSVGVGRPAPGLFTRALWGLLGMAGSPDQSGIGASSTACVGSVLTIGPAGREMLPVEITSGSCAVGAQCVIVSASKDSVTGLLHATGATACYGSGDAGGTLNAIKQGEDWTCTAKSGDPCINPSSSSTTCVYPADPITPGLMIAAWNDRLSRPGTCPDSFQGTFDYADGRSGPVSGPPGVGGSDLAGTVYVQKQCSNPRVGIVIVSDSSRTRVRGFAAVYILGCFDPKSNNATGQHECDEGDAGAAVEVRAVLLQLYMTSGAVGGIGPIDGTSPVTIQTTR
ncbi:MAG: hypothetical protein ACYC9W_09740 [Candidatus Limnocylindria bacterium]